MTAQLNYCNIDNMAIQAVMTKLLFGGMAIGAGVAMKPENG